jgi:hypothetical protein
MTEPDEAPPPRTLPPEPPRPDLSAPKPPPPGALAPTASPWGASAPEVRPEVAPPAAHEPPHATSPELPRDSPPDAPRDPHKPSPVLPRDAPRAPSFDPSPAPSRGLPRVPPPQPPHEPPKPPTDARRDPPPEPPRPRRHWLAWIAAAVFLVLAASQAALWVRVLVPLPGSESLDQRVQAIDARVTRLEQRPVPPDLAPLQARVAALEQRPATGSGAAAPVAAPQDVGPLEARIAALEQRPATGIGAAAPVAAPRDLGPLEARIAALEQRAPATTAPNSNDSLSQRLGADEGRLAKLEKTASEPQLADRTSRIARIEAAFIALSVGQPLGTLPGAPPPLARYATTAPPTDAALRLAFPAAVQAALAAAHPPPAGEPFLRRVWAEAQDLVTIRQGEHVVIGDPAAGVLAHAQTALDAGDLAGAAATVASLSGPAAQALAPWLDQAHGLLAARAALADLAAQT